MKYSVCSLLGFLGVLKKKSPVQRQRSDLPEDICRQFSLAEIKAATNNFHPNSIIGESWYGTVHRGKIDDGTIDVAVQRYQSTSLEGAKAFKHEAMLLSQLRHPHIISHLGFCDEQNEMIIVYAYMIKGSLAAFLSGNDDVVPLSWKQRLQIIIGVARGSHYLHTGAKYAVIHRDISSLNILLDNECSSKLTSFWFSMICPRNMSKLSSVKSPVVGTNGYIAPEYIMYGELTEKCDVFSFGVVLIEVLCGRRINNKMDGTIDPYLNGRIAPDCLKKYLEIASSCVKFNQNERPDMGEVMVTLELALELQEKADSEMEGLNPYDEEVSFSLSNFDYFRKYYSSGSIYSSEGNVNSDNNNNN